MQHFDQEVSQLLSTVIQHSSDSVSACRSVVDGLRSMFDATAPASLFFANTFIPSGNQSFVLYSHHHVGDYPQELEAFWDKHLVRGDSPILKEIRQSVQDAARVGVTHTFRRIDLVSNAIWFASRIYLNLAYKVNVWDQLFAWHHHHDHVIALILRSTRPRVFTEEDRSYFHYAFQSIVNSTEVSSILHPRRFQPRLTTTQKTIRDLIVAGFSNKKIALRLKIAMRTVDEHIDKIKAAYGISARRAKIAEEYYHRGGTPEEIQLTKQQYP